MVHHFAKRHLAAFPVRRRHSSQISQDGYAQPSRLHRVMTQAKDSTLSRLPRHVPHLHLKRRVDGGDGDGDWWFAGTAVPLLAATIGPLANVLSIAALVTSWRMCLVDGVDQRDASMCLWDGDRSSLVDDLVGQAFADPVWCYWLNVVSLILGFVGNLFLLFNFTGFVRYIIALPVTIILWYLATGILIAITISMNIHVAPIRPQQTYTQGFWYAIMAAALYFVASMLLMVNMLGYFLGHFPQHFELTDSQRTLILQTMMFFVWLAAGGIIFSKIETRYGDGSMSWSYVNGLYFSDVTILTVGFGDLVCTSDIGRGLVFPYSVGGIIMLGLVISSISKFAQELGSDKVIDKHRERSRARTFDRVVGSVDELKSRLHARSRAGSIGPRPIISAPFDAVNHSAKLRILEPPDELKARITKKQRSNPSGFSLKRAPTLSSMSSIPLRVPLRKRKPRILLLEEERDRFNEMRRIELKTTKWKRWTALIVSSFSFALLWLLGALVFYFAESESQHLSYFEALYFCYVSLLTIGYGDLAPKSNIGRPFFVVWSLIAVPTMTILVGAMGDTVVQGFKRGTERAAEVTILPRKGVVADLIRKLDPYLAKVSARKERKAIERRINKGFEVGPATADTILRRIETRLEDATSPDGDGQDRPSSLAPDIQTLANEAEADDKGRPPRDIELAKRLATAIQRVALDLRAVPPRTYRYEEWVEFTRLIKFTDYGPKRRRTNNTVNEGVSPTDSETVAVDDEEDGEEDELIEWDWIGKDSPMMQRQSEAEFVMDRLCESMGRYLRKQEVREKKEEQETGAGVVQAVAATDEDAVGEEDGDDGLEEDDGVGRVDEDDSTQTTVIEQDGSSGSGNSNT